jgi:uncharacterized protein (TIGR00290 family)
MENITCSWSGGKDCSFALLRAIEMGYVPKVLLNMMNQDGKTSRSHGLPVELLKMQAKAMNMDLLAVPTLPTNYEQNFIAALEKTKSEFAVQGVVYGDIDLEGHRVWQERVCGLVNLQPILPVWGINREVLAQQIVDSGIECIIVSCNLKMGESFLGRMYNAQLIAELKEIGIDSCGEDGEFHTFAINGPMFKHKVTVPDYSTKTENEFCYIDWKID